VVFECVSVIYIFHVYKWWLNFKIWSIFQCVIIEKKSTVENKKCCHVIAESNTNVGFLPVDSIVKSSKVLSVVESAYWWFEESYDSFLCILFEGTWTIKEISRFKFVLVSYCSPKGDHLYERNILVAKPFIVINDQLILFPGDAALLEAAKKGNLARVQKLVSEDNINCRDTQGRNSTPLHLAG